MNTAELLHLRKIESILDIGFDIFVESLVDKKYTSKEGFYLHEGAVGKVISMKYIPPLHDEDETDYLVNIEWLKDKIITYSFTGINAYDLRLSTKIKEIIPPKNPNQLELMFK